MVWQYIKKVIDKLLTIGRGGVIIKEKQGQPPEGVKKMKLSNQKTFENWCEKNGFRPQGLLDDAERWASECDTNGGDVETVAFEIVKSADEKTEAIYKFLG